MPRHTQNGKQKKIPAFTFFFRDLIFISLVFSFYFLAACSFAISTLPCIPTPLYHLTFIMSANGDKVVVDANAPESQFQKPGELVERDEDTGLMQVESLCMNCHDNVSVARQANHSKYAN